MESREPEVKNSNSNTERASDPSLKDPNFVENKDEVDGGDSIEEKGKAEGEGEGEEEEEEEGECGFCLFMKGGGCKESFIAWENCIEEAEKKNEDIVEKCFEVTGALKKCMEAHNDYYEPILRAEKKAEEEAVNELEKEKQAAANSSSAGSEAVNELEKEKQAAANSSSAGSEAVNELEKAKQAAANSSSAGSEAVNELHREEQATVPSLSVGSESVNELPK